MVMLFLREMKKIILSVPYLLFVAAVAIGLYSQGVFHFRDDLLTKPQSGGNYGFKQEEIPEIIMPSALRELWAEFCINDYTTYPIGFIKHVKLSEKDREKIAGILSEITGSSKETIFQKTASGNSNSLAFEIGDNNMQPDGEGGFTVTPDSKPQTSSEEWEPALHSGMDYPRFKELMQQTDDILGGGSSYAARSLIRYGSVPLTYQEAKERYDLAVSADRVTGGYARLFSDYAGVMVLSVLPVFLAVILCMKDRRARMEALLYTKKASAARIIAVRYFALIAAAMIPILILSYLSNGMVWSAYSGMTLDYLAPLKYDLGWLLPSVMISTAVGMFFTELTGVPIAVAVQGLWWLFDLNTGIKTVQSGYALFRLAPRHNVGARAWFRTQDYLDHFQNLLQNRLLFSGAALLLVGLTIFLYEAKRKGKFDGKLSLKKAVSHLRNRND